MVQDQEMGESRFETLASSYGSDLRRWPSDERDAAAQFVRVNVHAHAALNQQRPLDDQLASYVIAPPGSALVGRVLATAPSSASTMGRGRLWWSLGLLGAALAGGVSGAAAVALSLAVFISDLDAQTIFGVVTVTEFIDE